MHAAFSAHLAAQLERLRADRARFTLVVTDGVFSMDGHQARLPEIRDRYSSSLMPAIAVASLAALDLVERGDEPRARRSQRAASSRAGLGFTLLPGEHLIVPLERVGTPTRVSRPMTGVTETGSTPAALR